MSIIEFKVFVYNKKRNKKKTTKKRPTHSQKKKKRNRSSPSHGSGMNQCSTFTSLPKINVCIVLLQVAIWSMLGRAAASSSPSVSAPRIHHAHHHLPVISGSGNSVHLYYEGDILLGSLFPIHKQKNSKEPGDFCGEIQSEDGIQPLEAMLYTLDTINADPNILKGLRLGAIAYDSCDDPIHASEQAVSFLEGFMSRKYGDDEEVCTKSSNSSSSSGNNNSWSNLVVGMIGPQTSTVSVQLANLGRIFKVPQISYLSTSDKLCNSAEFPYFFRTVPSDVHQAKAIAELFVDFEWNYASVVHSDSEYGEMGYQALKEQFDSKGICLAKPLIIINKYFTSHDYQGIIHTLMNTKLSRIVIVFCDRIPAGRLLEAAKKLGVFDRFLWIGSDAWASRESVVKGRETAVLGAVAVQPLRRPYPGFDDYFRSLFESNHRNPWFDEYLRVYHNCSSKVENCSKKSNLIIEEQQLYIHFVRDAVYAFAHALDALLKDTCGKDFNGGLCPEFWNASREELRTYLENVTFKDIGGNDFQFYGSHEAEPSLKGSSSFFFRHDGPPRYTIINFQQRGDTYDWFKIGTYINGKIVLNSEIVNFTKSPVTSCARQECNPYEIRVPTSSDGCCWTCKQCSINEFRKSEYECGLCPLGQRSSKADNFTTCSLVPEIFMDFRDKWAIASMSFASIGIVMTLMTSFIFWKYWETPVVKASGRELSLLLLMGTFLSFSATFVIVAKPSNWTCGTMRFCIGFCYTICYAAVVTKTNRVARIFRMDNHNNNNPRWTSPLSSLLIAGALVSIEVLINIIWLIFEPPETVIVVSVVGKRILVCSGVDDNFMAGLVYPFILILGATIYAFKTRKCPGGFNETRYIFFANAVTTIHWIAYVPLYLVSADPHIRAVILALSLCLSAIVQLGCLLFPKLYTVLFKPEKNTRDAVMTSHHQRRFPNQNTPNNFRSSSFLFQEYSSSRAGSTLEMSRSSFETMTGNEQRHLTWSHTLSAVEENHFHQHPSSHKVKPRTRSTSISRSTQTQVHSHSPLDPSRKGISFVVNISDDDELVYEEDLVD